MFQNLTLKGSGENAMVTMLQPGAFAPTGEALEQKLLALPREVPLSFIYGGTRDWMTSSHGVRVVESLRVDKQCGKQHSTGLNKDSVAPVKAAADGLSTITILESAGHHVMLDAADEFNAAVLAAANT
jgi:pimeloyl-ACP methyl ester carboxylesterase